MLVVLSFLCGSKVKLNNDDCSAVTLSNEISASFSSRSNSCAAPGSPVVAGLRKAILWPFCSSMILNIFALGLLLK